MGSISSLGIGSGLDLNGLLDQLESAEREKLAPIERQAEAEQTKISAYGQLESDLSTFQDAASALSDGSLFESLSTNTSGEAVSASADETAMPGSYNITVDTLATRGTLASDGVAEGTLTTADQNMTFTFGDSSETTVAIAADSSLEDIRDAINADENAGVNATIINDGTQDRLAVSSRESGADASISNFTFDGDAPFAADTDNTLQAGTDAALNVNGIDITSPTNQVEGAIQGVTLNLQSEGTGTVAVEQDTRAVREAVTSFVDSYNALKETTSELTNFDPETGEAGPLNGDSAVRTAESSLRSVLSGGVASGGDGISMLSQVGISLEVDGTLSLDEDKLSDVVANDQQALADFFVGTENNPGMASQVDTRVEQLLGSSGAVQGAITSSENIVDSLGDRYTRMEQDIGRTIERYRTQFGQLDGMIAEMNQTSSYLTQQFASLDAQLGR
ncbi:flagellar filament capping protein FliD [Halomonas sp. CUBES01]|uniref:Flagellar hook-associated protein 2 n=1 Tax=Vreelandella gomseomensis TaxID=370766 RepID=A0ABU1GFF9_9GAMM|nr:MULTISPECIES: flagellar filament capping protein FliD [Halomonas]MDR5876201.1 flagellar filament capping protein FliD [Halomonas gomseomensis]MEC4768511.1 flagellar filament capping protein FliD [Halomonas sp. CUBES01]